MRGGGLEGVDLVMRDKIMSLEVVARQLDPTSEARGGYARLALDHAEGFLAGIETEAFTPGLPALLAFVGTSYGL